MSYEGGLHMTREESNKQKSIQIIMELLTDAPPEKVEELKELVQAYLE